MTQRLLILVGLIVASVAYAVLTNGLGLGKPIDVAASSTPPGSARRDSPRRCSMPGRCC